MGEEEFHEQKEEDVYSNEAREDLEDNDEISPEEGAFMEGYDSGEELNEEKDNDKYENAFEEGEEDKTEEDEPEDEF